VAIQKVLKSAEQSGFESRLGQKIFSSSPRVAWLWRPYRNPLLQSMQGTIATIINLLDITYTPSKALIKIEYKYKSSRCRRLKFRLLKFSTNQ
jgi:hypothetical protein